MSNAIGIDLGTSSILIYEKNKGIAVREPSAAVIENDSENTVFFGNSALKMVGHTNDFYTTVFPVRNGVISDFDIAKKMLRFYVQKLCRHSIVRPDIILSVPSSITPLEEQAAVDAAKFAGARRVFLVESVLAAAVGAGVDFSRPEGRAVIDIGGGTCNIGVFSLGSIVESRTIKTGGIDFNSSLKQLFYRNYDLLIGNNTAENIKMHIGGLTSRPSPLTMNVQGQDISTHALIEYSICCEDIKNAFLYTADSIIYGIRSVFENIPPELMIDIKESGITLTGGGSLLWGIGDYIREKTGINTAVYNDAVSCCVNGLGKLCMNLDNMKDGIINLQRKKFLQTP